MRVKGDGRAIVAVERGGAGSGGKQGSREAGRRGGVDTGTCSTTVRKG